MVAFGQGACKTCSTSSKVYVSGFCVSKCKFQIVFIIVNWRRAFSTVEPNVKNGETFANYNCYAINRDVIHAEEIFAWTHRRTCICRSFKRSSSIILNLIFGKTCRCPGDMIDNEITLSALSPVCQYSANRPIPSRSRDN